MVIFHSYVKLPEGTRSSLPGGSKGLPWKPTLLYRSKDMFRLGIVGHCHPGWYWMCSFNMLQLRNPQTKKEPLNTWNESLWVSWSLGFAGFSERLFHRVAETSHRTWVMELSGMTAEHYLFHLQTQLPSGYVKIAIENCQIYSGFSAKKNVIFHSYVKLPEGNPYSRCPAPLANYLKGSSESDRSVHLSGSRNHLRDIFSGEPWKCSCFFCNMHADVYLYL